MLHRDYGGRVSYCIPLRLYSVAGIEIRPSSFDNHRYFFSHSFRTKSLALYYDLKHSISCLNYDETNKKIVTVGPDHTLKIWNVKSIL